LNDGQKKDPCPICGSELVVTGEGRMECPDCHYSYIEEDGILIFDLRDMESRWSMEDE